MIKIDNKIGPSRSSLHRYRETNRPTDDGQGGTQGSFTSKNGIENGSINVRGLPIEEPRIYRRTMVEIPRPTYLQLKYYFNLLHIYYHVRRNKIGLQDKTNHEKEIGVTH